MGKYILRCKACGKEYEDKEFLLSCEDEKIHGESLLEAVYEKKEIDVKEKLPGIFKYVDWLPTGEYYLDSANHSLFGTPYVYKSEGLARRFGLRNLYIAFSGHWPARGVKLITRTFKEFEVPATIARYLSVNIRKEEIPPLIISSAGNTANAFIYISYSVGIPVVAVVPKSSLDKLVLPIEVDAELIAVEGDYTDAIEVANKIAEITGLQKEGGVRNVARRAGLGAVMLHAVANPQEGIGELFDHYFQAVGSATGAIGVWEAVKLLIKDGRFGNKKTKIHMAQNKPFTPIPDFWENGEILKNERESKKNIDYVTAKVLTNRNPPLKVKGGVYDVLKESGGMTWRVDNYNLFHSARAFRELEGIDIGPAAAVAVDALRQAVEKGAVKKHEKILLHITGGGREIQYITGDIFSISPKIVIRKNEIENLAGLIREKLKEKKIINPSKYLRRI